MENTRFQEPAFLQSFCDAFRNPSRDGENSDLSGDTHFVDVCTDARVIRAKDAFSVGILSCFARDEALGKLRTELLQQPFYQKHNDLYKFMQSEDLKCMPKESALGQFRQQVQSAEFVGWMSALTGIELLPGRVDLAGQRYLQGDRLLCHDDDIMATGEDGVGRRIAFILYLVPPEEEGGWTASDGGRLELFRVDSASNWPTQDVVAQIVPQWNTFAFFEVTPISYHQVSEVLCADKERISITGWFYGPLPKTRREKKSFPHSAPKFVRVPSLPSAKICESFIRPEYLRPESIQKVCQFFVDNSFVELQEVLLPEQYRDVCALRRKIVEPKLELWGSPNACKYQRKLADSLTDTLSGFFLSDSFLNLLKQWTNLEVHAYRAEYRSFSQGHYTLMHDLGECAGPLLELTFDMGAAMEAHGETKHGQGGEIIFIDGEEELLRFTPMPNKLSLVYRDGGDMAFVSYMPQSLPAQGRRDLFIQFQIKE